MFLDLLELILTRKYLGTSNNHLINYLNNMNNTSFKLLKLEIQSDNIIKPKRVKNYFKKMLLNYKSSDFTLYGNNGKILLQS